ncbi:MAG: DedA family protein [Gemmatimonadales bacterium]
MYRAWRGHRGDRGGAARGGAHLTELIGFLESLPEVPLYAVVGVFAAIENIFPPAPADVAIGLGAFLAGRGTLDLWTVFAVTWVCNVGSAALVYAVGRRYGRAFFAGRLGRRLLSERTLAHIEEAYAEHGSWGIFVSRLLPVWRAVVPPFAGVARVPAGRFLFAVALASGLYYGALTYLVATLGTNLEAVNHALARVNVVLGVVAAVLLLAFVIWILRRLKR